MSEKQPECPLICIELGKDAIERQRSGQGADCGTKRWPGNCQVRQADPPGENQDILSSFNRSGTFTSGISLTLELSHT